MKKPSIAAPKIASKVSMSGTGKSATIRIKETVGNSTKTTSKTIPLK